MRRIPESGRRLTPVVLFVLLLLAPPVTAGATPRTWSTPVGLWSPLDGSGKPLGLIAIYEDHGLYYGRIEPSSPTDDRSARCTRCTGSRHDQPIIGLVLMRHLRFENGAYIDGDILDPDTGRIWGCELRLIDGGRRLLMRGYLGIPLFGRSQVWQRMQGRPGIQVWPVPDQ